MNFEAGRVYFVVRFWDAQKMKSNVHMCHNDKIAYFDRDKRLINMITGNEIKVDDGEYYTLKPFVIPHN